MMRAETRACGRNTRVKRCVIWADYSFTLPLEAGKMRDKPGRGAAR